MRWAVLLLLAISFASLSWFLKITVFADLSQHSNEPSSGMAVLRAHQCLFAETKKILIRGKEDDYSAAGDEVARINPRLLEERHELIRMHVNYDGADRDRILTDYFEVPTPAASGLILLKMQPNGDNANDTIRLGDMVPDAKGQYSANSFEASVADLARLPHWHRARDFYWAELSDLQLASGKSMLEYLNEAGSNQIVDIAVTDDTSVDFAGMVVCLRPPRGKGLSFHYRALPAASGYGVAEFTCAAPVAGEPGCDPYVGDASCKAALPLLCFAEEKLPVPAALKSAANGLGAQRWSGGQVAATSPVRGDSFKTIDEADRYCASQLGGDWRVADFHLGGRGFGFAAKLRGEGFSGRYWIDIRDQPYATCWKRSE